MAHTWTEISGHSCGRYKEDADKRIDEAQRNVKRYMHYHTRWWAVGACMNAEHLSLQLHCPVSSAKGLALQTKQQNSKRASLL
jgi:hypothetical protein